MKYFLVWRDKDGPRRIDIYNEDEWDAALGASAAAESLNAAKGAEEHVCLFEALVSPETISVQSLLDAAEGQGRR